jgi:hypothetical protein
MVFFLLLIRNRVAENTDIFSKKYRISLIELEIYLRSNGNKMWRGLKKA